MLLSFVTQFDHTHKAVACASQGCKTPKGLQLNLNGMKEEKHGGKEQGCCCTVKMKFIIHFEKKQLPCILLEQIIKTVTLITENVMLVKQI